MELHHLEIAVEMKKKRFERTNLHFGKSLNPGCPHSHNPDCQCSPNQALQCSLNKALRLCFLNPLNGYTITRRMKQKSSAAKEYRNSQKPLSSTCNAKRVTERINLATKLSDSVAWRLETRRENTSPNIQR
ncbi:uncharacterized protein G2W53_008322 [Senna tora]|uniref:Uncharacterized protein n=1 Tax=Senna tora TaxID=362788 RepID=A0A834X8A1_9FABA|nr:uncharacterized protein G2W53_008322 [Senna tora]